MSKVLCSNILQEISINNNKAATPYIHHKLQKFKIIGKSQHQPIRCEDCERRRLVAQVVHLLDRNGDTALGHHLLVLRGGALKGLPHVDVLQRNYKNKEKQLIHYYAKWAENLIRVKELMICQ